MTIQVILAEDNTLLREGMRHLIEAETDLHLLAACGDLPSLLGSIDDTRPDVVLTDIRMPPGRTDEGIQAARYCRAHHPGTGVVLLSQYVDPGYVRALLDQGTESRGTC
jgi:DNA-binding NarL/FixJ family response regulator